MVVQVKLSAPEERVPVDSFATRQRKIYTTGNQALMWMKKISSNVITPGFVLRQLAASCDPELKMAVADHVNTPLEVLLRLAVDEDPDVRFALAENHNISREVLNKLTDDSNPYVAQRAEKTLSRVRINDSLYLSWRSCRSS